MCPVCMYDVCHECILGNLMSKGCPIRRYVLEEVTTVQEALHALCLRRAMRIGILAPRNES